MTSRRWLSGGAIVLSLFVFSLASSVDPELDGSRVGVKGLGGLSRVLDIDGSSVHDVGELRVHVANWGLFGSCPTGNYPFSDQPSAEWPAGSGVEHLYGAGLWVGAIKNGVPAVSTSHYEIELRPTDDPVDVVYETAEGAPGGNRYPGQDPDDDGDGLIDEDWLNGRDDDGDGLIDEDFAAISDEMFACWYSDTTQASIDIFPQHNPLGILVRQESYQWSHAMFDDFVGIDFTITNVGNDVLEDLYLGFFADPDVGLRTRPSYWTDDATAAWASPARCTGYGPTRFDMAYAFDSDGDGGEATSYFGVVLFGHTTDPFGVRAPTEVRISSYQNFSGEQSFEDGGDPTNDFERYELLAAGTWDRGSSVLRDIRMLISVGPFPELAPGESVVFQLGLVAGDGFSGLVSNAEMAKLTFDGAWYNRDGDMTTGVSGRETRIPGPAQNVVIDSCQAETSEPIDVPEDTVIWINTDCALEEDFRIFCGYAAADSLHFQTGVAGRETNVHWILQTENPVPVLVGSFDAFWGEGGVKLAWRVTADENVEGYRVFRQADDRNRLDLLNHGSLIAPSTMSFLDETAERGRTYIYKLGVVLADGSEVYSPPVAVASAAPQLELKQNFPNPFNPSTTISFSVPATGYAKLAVYDPSGRLVRKLVDEMVPTGNRTVSWDGKDDNGDPVSSGVYFYRLAVGDRSISRKTVYIK